MEIKAKTEVYINGTKTPVKQASAEYNGIGKHVRALKKIALSIAVLADDNRITAEEEFSTHFGQRVCVRVLTFRAVRR